VVIKPQRQAGNGQYAIGVVARPRCVEGTCAKLQVRGAEKSRERGEAVSVMCMQDARYGMCAGHNCANLCKKEGSVSCVESRECEEKVLRGGGGGGGGESWENSAPVSQGLGLNQKRRTGAGVPRDNGLPKDTLWDLRKGSEVGA